MSITGPNLSQSSQELYLKRVLQVVVYAGEIMLRSGAETSRVEETIDHLTRAFGVADANSVVTPTGLFVSLNNPTHDLPLTLVRRVRGRSLNFSRLAAVNELSRQAEHSNLTPDEVSRELEKLDAAQNLYPFWLWLAAGAVTAAGVTVLLGGSVLDSAITLGSALLVQLWMWLLERFKIPRIFGEFSGATIATALALFFSWLGWPIHETLVIAGGIIMLVPGAALLASVQDGIAGDLLSSGSRLLETLVKGTAIAGGAGLSLKVAETLNYRASVEATQGEFWQIPIQVIAAFIGSSCYAMVYHTPKRSIIGAGLTGGFGWLIYLLAQPATNSALISTFLGAFGAGLFSWWMARIKHTPMTLYALPGVLPLLPGLSIYGGMLALSQNRSNDGLIQLITAAFLGGAIAAGVALSNSILAQIRRLIPSRPKNH